MTTDTDMMTELIERLAALRIRWEARRRVALYTRESADGWTAGIASAEADLYGQMIAELDKAMV
jgi:hypothetical protein